MTIIGHSTRRTLDNRFASAVGCVICDAKLPAEGHWLIMDAWLRGVCEKCQTKYPAYARALVRELNAANASEVFPPIVCLLTAEDTLDDFVNPEDAADTLVWDRGSGTGKQQIRVVIAHCYKADPMKYPPRADGRYRLMAISQMKAGTDLPRFDALIRKLIDAPAFVPPPPPPPIPPTPEEIAQRKHQHRIARLLAFKEDGFQVKHQRAADVLRLIDELIGEKLAAK